MTRLKHLCKIFTKKFNVKLKDEIFDSAIQVCDECQRIWCDNDCYWIRSLT